MINEILKGARTMYNLKRKMKKRERKSERENLILSCPRHTEISEKGNKKLLNRR